MYSILLKEHQAFSPVLEIEKGIKIPSPNDDEVLIKVHAASINPIDCRVSQGYGWSIFAGVHNIELPIVLGRDFVGDVVAKGRCIRNYKNGDTVWGVVNPFRKGGFKNGAMSEYVLVKEEEIGLKPSNISKLEAASMPYVFLTTWNSLFSTARLSPMEMKGKKVFINGGSGGVGSNAIQMLKAYGAAVIVSCNSTNVDKVKQLGADEVMAYNTCDYSGLSNVDIVYNLVPFPDSKVNALETLSSIEVTQTQKEQVIKLSEQLLRELNKVPKNALIIQYKKIITKFDDTLSKISNSTPVFVSIVSPMMTSVDALGMDAGMYKFVKTVIQKKVYEFITHGRHYHYGFFAPNSGALKELKQLVEQKLLKPHISSSFEIEDIEKAFDLVNSKHAGGKVVLKMV